MVFPLLVVLCIKAVAAQTVPVTESTPEPTSTGAGILTPGQTITLTVNETAPLSQFAVGFGSGSAFSAVTTVFPGPGVSSTSFDLIIPSLSATTAEVFISFFGSTTLSAIATVTLAPETSKQILTLPRHRLLQASSRSVEIEIHETPHFKGISSSSETSTTSTDISSTSAILITECGFSNINADTPTPTDTVTTNPSLSSTSLSASATAFISNSPSSLSRTKNIRAIIGGTIGAVLLVLLTLIALFLWIKRRHKPEPMTFRGDIMVRASHNGSTTSSPYETMPVLGAYNLLRASFPRRRRMQNPLAPIAWIVGLKAAVGYGQTDSHSQSRIAKASLRKKYITSTPY
ncbi:hypothetical protein BT96DRAFT_995716 [Gymnopus androsaceus JB14]|uniref:Mid2 domain-containing protein n=1 Tax=Gymnopus androsaceus JB14 TaxID=1447944 RepID=A0A6A4HKU5_9AGAR|nr:hypothetical protein BT96DRAFT_995716 [Gymnopus androsaceus JB14]